MGKPLMESLRSQRECVLIDPAGLPRLPDNLRLPPDVEAFYTECGGARLFPGALYSMDIVKPDEFVRANPVIAGTDDATDISHDWFVIGRSDTQYVTTDLDPRRLGRCYDSSWDSHAVAGSCALVAECFTEFVWRMLAAKGRHWYWLQPSFRQLDAYANDGSGR